MPKLIALLRGINVGKAKRVAMTDLRKVVEKLGYTAVRTLLNSGNVVFTATESPRRAAARIEFALLEQLGVPARVVVVSAVELAAAVSGNSLLPGADNPSRLLVAFLADPADRLKLRALVDEKWGKDAIAIGPRVAYLWLPGGVADSKLLRAVSRALDDAVTSRNWATVLKLHTLVGNDAPTPPTSQTRGG